jgi:hypothetical protein
MKFEIKKMIFASGLLIAVGVVLILIAFIFQVLPLLITGSYTDAINLLNTVYAFLLYPVFLLLYFWGGIRAVSRYGFDAVGAGTVSAFSYFVTGLIQLMLSAILNIVILSRATASAGFATPESVLAVAIFGDIAGVKGIGLSALCGIGVLIVGSMINFVIGGFGGIYASRKPSSSS